MGMAILEVACGVVVLVCVVASALGWVGVYQDPNLSPPAGENVPCVFLLECGAQVTVHCAALAIALRLLGV